MKRDHGEICKWGYEYWSALFSVGEEYIYLSSACWWTTIRCLFSGRGGGCCTVQYIKLSESIRGQSFEIKTALIEELGTGRFTFCPFKYSCLHPLLLSISPSSEIADCFIVLQSSRQFLFFSRRLLQNRKKKIILSSKDTTLSLCLQHLRRRIDWS